MLLDYSRITTSNLKVYYNNYDLSIPINKWSRKMKEESNFSFDTSIVVEVLERMRSFIYQRSRINAL
jgi:hypothetical protein